MSIAEQMEVAKDILRPRVEKGAAYLDEYHPGWVNAIDIWSLHMSDCRRCIGGQLMEDYHYLHEEIRNNTGMCGAELGFDVTEAGSICLEKPEPPTGTSEYMVLEELWLDQIEARRTP